MKKLNYSFLSSKFDWVTLNGKWSKWHSQWKVESRFSVLTNSRQLIQKFQKKNEGKREEKKIKLKKKEIENSMFRFKADYESLFTKNLLSSSVQRRHKRLIALNFKGFKFYSVNRCEMNFRENETKRYFQKNFLSLSLSLTLSFVHTQRWKRR